ncbi:MAG: hypothetical protein LBU70_04915, partial [Chitinispirillales bacterium]|nr:hypothetical protein [Chitinispirillales bacterium]
MTTTKPVFSLITTFFTVLTLLALPAALSAGQRDPFPFGRSMMSQGAIIETEGATGREPWASAAFYRDTLQWGASMAAISYHGGGAAAQYAAGGFWVAGPVVCKASLMQLDVMSVYYEQTAALSAGSTWRFLSFGADAQIYRTGLYDSRDDRRTMAAVGAAAIIQNRRISADAAIQNITVLSSGEPGADPSPYITFRVCTVRNRYGSQGAMIKITPNDDAPVRLTLAQEYRIGQMFAFAASIASNPTMIGFGVSIEKSPVNGSAAVVNHP